MTKVVRWGRGKREEGKEKRKEERRGDDELGSIHNEWNVVCMYRELYGLC
jgi:hypothetical protein